MAGELLRSKHAFGDSTNLSTALESGTVDAYDILFLDGATEPKIGWVDKDGNPIILENKKQIVRVESLPTENGDENVVYIFENEAYIWNSTESKCAPLAKSTDLTTLETQVATLETAMETKVDIETVQNMIEEAVFESSGTEVVEF